MLISHLILAQIRETDPKLYEEIIQEYNRKYENLLNSNAPDSDTNIRSAHTETKQD